jgi:hypothetical protein
MSAKLAPSTLVGAFAVGVVEADPVVDTTIGAELGTGGDATELRGLLATKLDVEYAPFAGVAAGGGLAIPVCNFPESRFPGWPLSGALFIQAGGAFGCMDALDGGAVCVPLLPVVLLPEE